jgi:hypothetical protein
LSHLVKVKISNSYSRSQVASEAGKLMPANPTDIPEIPKVSPGVLVCSLTGGSVISSIGARMVVLAQIKS